ncbi:SsgA family sporulation/cell division regulator [uncultured Streptomyces sp.]|uniref:SsgA family sporulation/cell division regulator n=1 Tax=uncultured Streptomyces sp. TaxID=174707 RepID=UPI002608AC99|nr:SsgA family sporulation/cell division regulator [uncultured Streptomyces sp.]
MDPVIEEHARARLITDGPLTRPVPVVLRYDTSDAPGTVRLRFGGGTERALGRDLLEQGLRSPAERDGVRIWPCGRAQLILELHGARGVEVFQIDNTPLLRFLRRTHAEAGAPRPAGTRPSGRPAAVSTAPDTGARTPPATASR